MWFDGQRQPNTIYVANTSRGKDSTAMLRAIQLMGWPLDMICSVDIWFDDDTPAELPPMVAFKDEYDRKVLDWFGVPVTRLCATKREPKDKEDHSRLSYEKLFYDRVYSNKHGWHIKGFPNTNHSWCKLLKDQLDGRYAFQADLLRHILPPDNAKERERGRETSRQLLQEGRRLQNLRVALPERPVVQQRPQAKHPIGFPNRWCLWCNGELKRGGDYQGFSAYPPAGRTVVSRPPQGFQRERRTMYGYPARAFPWCQSMLKGGILDSPLHYAPERGAENKYRSLHRHRSRRATSHCQTLAQEGQGAAAGADRLGRGSVRFGSKVHGHVVPNLHGRPDAGWVLVLPQPGRKPTAEASKNVPRPVGKADEVRSRQSGYIPRRRSHRPRL